MLSDEISRHSKKLNIDSCSCLKQKFSILNALKEKFWYEHLKSELELSNLSIFKFAKLVKS